MIGRRRRLGVALGWLAAATLAAHAETAPPPTAAPARPPFRDRVFFGGSIGASFGDIDYVAIAPTVGVLVAPKLSVGVAPFWVHRDDSTADVSTSDVGFDLYGRYRVIPQAFAQIQYSYTDFEYALTGGGTASDSYSAVLAGGGWVQPLGGRSSFIVSTLYDFSYDDDEPSPYDDPWVVSAGVVFGF
jgi:hypothetical protein